MAMMRYYSTVEELINQIKGVDTSYRNLHTNVYIKTDNRLTGETDTFVIPYKSVVLDYMPYFRECAITLPMGEVEKTKYRFKPKRLSNKLYGTPELWSALLELNYMVSVIDFNLEKDIQVFEPKRFKELLNEVMILEGILK